MRAHGLDDLATTQEPEGRGRAHDVLTRLRSDILCLHLAPGEAISERDLEESYAASRTPIRAVLSRLIDEGLVVRTARGHAVAPFDLSQIEEIFEFREIAEAAAVRLACMRADPVALDAMQADLDQSLTAFTPDRWMEAGLDFHVRLAGLSGNRFLVDAVRSATIRTLRARWLVARSEAGRRASHAEHTAILAHLRVRDPREAEAAVIAHSRDIKRQVIDAIEAARAVLGRRSFADGGAAPRGQDRMVSSGRTP